MNSLFCFDLGHKNGQQGSYAQWKDRGTEGGKEKRMKDRLEKKRDKDNSHKGKKEFGGQMRA